MSSSSLARPQDGDDGNDSGEEMKALAASVADGGYPSTEVEDVGGEPWHEQELYDLRSKDPMGILGSFFDWREEQSREHWPHEQLNDRALLMKMEKLEREEEERVAALGSDLQEWRQMMQNQFQDRERGNTMKMASAEVSREEQQQSLLGETDVAEEAYKDCARLRVGLRHILDGIRQHHWDATWAISSVRTTPNMHLPPGNASSEKFHLTAESSTSSPSRPRGESSSGAFRRPPVEGSIASRLQRLRAPSAPLLPAGRGPADNMITESAASRQLPEKPEIGLAARILGSGKQSRSGHAAPTPRWLQEVDSENGVVKSSTAGLPQWLTEEVLDKLAEENEKDFAKRNEQYGRIQRLIEQKRERNLDIGEKTVNGRSGLRNGNDGEDPIAGPVVTKHGDETVTDTTSIAPTVGEGVVDLRTLLREERRCSTKINEMLNAERLRRVEQLEQLRSREAEIARLQAVVDAGSNSKICRACDLRRLGLPVVLGALRRLGAAAAAARPSAPSTLVPPAGTTMDSKRIVTEAREALGDTVDALNALWGRRRRAPVGEPATGGLPCPSWIAEWEEIHQHLCARQALEKLASKEPTRPHGRK
eukprot:TRINITY_DN18058_c0_g1_i2.p1 TRINITY_DN18058_c0_g1~~TRINITY_DN18058_c0_g1_i2.p1  ORF type:complete len:611 (+),score=129.16 TRINITY_DN18058_c0_g1_i2:56-1834(+)